MLGRDETSIPVAWFTDTMTESSLTDIYVAATLSTCDEGTYICTLGDFHFYIQACVIYGCSQPRELWFIDFNHVRR